MTDQTDPTAIPSMFARPMPPGVTSNPPPDPATKAEIEEAMGRCRLSQKQHQDVAAYHRSRGSLLAAAVATQSADVCGDVLDRLIDRWTIADAADKWQAELEEGQ